MTDFVLGSGDFIRPFRTPWGATHTKSIRVSTGVSTQVIRVGQTVVLDASGSTSFRDCVVPCAVSSATLNPAANTIVGVAAETPSVTNLSTSPGGTQMISVWDANPMQEFRARTRFGVITSSIVGTLKELGRDSTLNIDVVMLNVSSLATPVPAVIITQLLDSPGDSGGAVAFKFISSNLAFYR